MYVARSALAAVATDPGDAPSPIPTTSPAAEPQSAASPARSRTMPRPARWGVRACAGIGGAAILACMTAMVILHLLPVTDEVDPISQPVSKYALTADGALFDWAIVATAAGLAAIMAALILDRRTDRTLMAALAATALGLIAVVIFPDVTTTQGFTPIGRAHWIASMIAFGVMPVVPLRMYLLHRGLGGCARVSALCGRSAAAALACFATLFVGNVIAFATGLPLWRVGGLVERLLVAAELTAAAVVALWTWRGCACSRTRYEAASGRTLRHGRAVRA